MRLRELSIPGAYEATPVQHLDDRGVFLEWYRFDALAEAVGHPLDLRQANMSVSRRGSLRGIHYADFPRSQAKYVTVTHGAILDYVIDLRVGSPTFGQWDSVLLDTTDRRAVYLAEGLGHAFVALSDEASVTYLVSEVYTPGREHGIHPLDPEIGLVLPEELGEPILSPKDSAAPSLQDALRADALPHWETACAHYDSLA